MAMRARFALAALAAVVLLSVHACGEDDPGAPEGTIPTDTTAPGAVADLRVHSFTESALTVVWTAPGDDGAEGQASRYVIRYATSPITTESWATCAEVASVPAPTVAGTEQSVTIGSPPQPDVYVALKTADEVPNWSVLSNVAHGFLGSGIEIHQLTNGGNNIQPCLNDGFVTWICTNSVTGDELWIANLESAVPTPTCLTDNGGQKAYPSSHGSAKVAWQGRASGSDDWEIFVYGDQQVPRYAAFTDNDIPDFFPVLAGGGAFAWLRGYTMFEEVHYWNEFLHAEYVLSDDCCPTEEYSNDRPTADDYTVVWRSYHRSVGTGFRTWQWRGGLTDLSEEVDATFSHDYSLQGGDLAYEWGSGPSMITYWDGTSTQTVAAGYEPSLYQGTIAFEVFDGHDWEIRYWNGTTVHVITDNDHDDTQVSLYGDMMAWVGRSEGLDEIFFARLHLRASPGDSRTVTRPRLE